MQHCTVGPKKSTSKFSVFQSMTCGQVHSETFHEIANNSVKFTVASTVHKVDWRLFSKMFQPLKMLMAVILPADNASVQTLKSLRIVITNLHKLEIFFKPSTCGIRQ